jgi:hypothetical protein
MFIPVLRGRERGCRPRGARAVADYPLEARALSANVKKTALFGGLIQRIRSEGFDTKMRSNP